MDSFSDNDEKFDGLHILVMGATGFIGRQLVCFLLEQREVGRIIAADKRIVALSHFSPRILKRWDSEKVQFVQADLGNPNHLKNRIFNRQNYDFIFNLCGETRFGLLKVEYENRIANVAKMASAMAVGHCRKWIELSTAIVYEGSKIPLDEKGLIGPWNVVAEFRYQAEKILIQQNKLPCTILRASIVYGPGDTHGIMPRLVMAAAYKEANEKMKFLWTKGVQINTVHVTDVCGAMWEVTKYDNLPVVLNLSDPSNFTQLDFNHICERLLNMEVGFQPKYINMAAKVNISAVAEQVNSKHSPMWNAVVKKYGLSLNNPLSPFIDEQLLAKNHLGVDGSLITKVTKFRYAHPGPTTKLFAEMLDEYIEMGYYPKLKLQI